MELDNYWAIAEADIEIQNPVTDRKLRLLDDYCDIRDGLSVLDVGSGIGGAAFLLAQSHGARVTGIDLAEEMVARWPTVKQALEQFATKETA